MAVNAMFWHKLCFVSCFLSIGLTSAGISNISVVSCTNVRSIFEGRGITTLDILEEPITGGVCSTPASCCSSSASTYLTASARRELESTVRSQVRKVADMLKNRVKRLDEVLRGILASSKQGAHQKLTRAYGLTIAQLSMDLFTDLERYHARGNVDLATAFDRFFNILYQKAFAIINSQYHFDDKYLSCIGENMRELQPFGDTPRKTVVQMKRAFVAARTVTRALAIAADVARNVANMRGHDTCGPLMVSVHSCGACSGAIEKACRNLCLNAARACLSPHADISADWNAFVDIMDKVFDKLLGPFSFMVVESFDLKISDALTNFQENSYELTNTVFSRCGLPVLGQRPAETKNSSSIPVGNSSYNSRILQHVLHSVKWKLSKSQTIWSKLPQVYCDKISAPDGDDKCWNGTHVAKYLPALAINPERRGSSASPESDSGTSAVAPINVQNDALRSIIGKLQNAYNGQDVEWAEEKETATFTVGPDSGSGDDTNDNEDSTEPGGPPDQEESHVHDNS